MIGLAALGLVTAVWQGILLAAVAWLVLRLVPRTPAAVRFAIWFAVFAVVAALPLVSVLPHEAIAGGRGAWLTIDPRWSLAIAGVWAVASLVRAVSLVVAAARVRALWKRATPVDFGALQQSANAGILPLRQAEGQNDSSRIRRRAELCVSDEVDRPTVIGFFAPKILIPGWLLEKLTPAELEQVVLHETGHLGRADDWMNLLQKIALVVFPLNPVLAWVERRLCLERELAVDERVLQVSAGKAGAAKAYAACLATLAEYRLERRCMAPGLALVLGALGRESELGRRVGRILRRGEKMNPLHARLVLGGAMLGLVGAAVGLERCPQVIGFGDRSAPTVAHASEWQPTHGVETAMNGAPGGAFRPIEILAKSQDNSDMQKKNGVAHEVLLKAVSDDLGHGAGALEGVSQRLKPQFAGPVYGSAKAVPVTRMEVGGSARMIQTSAAEPEARGARMVSDVEPSQAAAGEMQWVVVTTWQGPDGSRMVMTTVRRSAVEQEAGASSVGNSALGADQVYPYAAVPVRGGWLVIQM